MANSTRDPRSEAEKAIADLKRNAEMDMSLDPKARSSVSPRSRPTPSASTTSRRAGARATIRASRLAASFPNPRRARNSRTETARAGIRSRGVVSGGGEVVGALGCGEGVEQARLGGRQSRPLEHNEQLWIPSLIGFDFDRTCAVRFA